MHSHLYFALPRFVKQRFKKKANQETFFYKNYIYIEWFLKPYNHRCCSFDIVYLLFVLKNFKHHIFVFLICLWITIYSLSFVIYAGGPNCWFTVSLLFFLIDFVAIFILHQHPPFILVVCKSISDIQSSICFAGMVLIVNLAFSSSFLSLLMWSRSLFVAFTSVSSSMNGLNYNRRKYFLWKLRSWENSKILTER